MSTDVHPIVRAAAEGTLPDWACARPKRRAHMERVAALMERWAARRAPHEVTRWRAAALLHDSLRDADANALRPLVPAPQQDWPAKLLHGPAAAARLEAAGVDDRELLTAITFHTVGAAGLGDIGRALFAADYLEPARTHSPAELSVLRARMPDAFTDVVADVLRLRVQHILDRGMQLRLETIDFWNELARARTHQS